MQAKVVQEPIRRLYSLCMYISMETVVGTPTGLSAFISVFSTMLYKLQKISKIMIIIWIKITTFFK